MLRLGWIRWFGGTLAGLLFAMAPTHATQVRPLNIEQLTAKAGRIAAGRCLRVDVSEDPVLGRNVTTVTLLVDRTLKGPAGHQLTFRMIGGSRSPAAPAGPVGIPSFRPGDEVVLFLYPESAAGLTSPVGLGQGRFRIERDKLGRSIAVNGFGNHGLLERLSDETRAGPGAAASRRPGSALTREELLDIVSGLVSRAESHR